MKEQIKEYKLRIDRAIEIMEIQASIDSLHTSGNVMDTRSIVGKTLSTTSILSDTGALSLHQELNLIINKINPARAFIDLFQRNFESFTDRYMALRDIINGFIINVQWDEFYNSDVSDQLSTLIWEIGDTQAELIDYQQQLEVLLDGKQKEAVAGHFYDDLIGQVKAELDKIGGFQESFEDFQASNPYSPQNED